MDHYRYQHRIHLTLGLFLIIWLDQFHHLQRGYFYPHFISSLSYSNYFLACWLSGRVNVNFAPVVSLLLLLLLVSSIQILPPCASSILLEMYNPRPTPFCDLVMNLSNNLSFTSKSIPVPRSEILTASILLLLLLFLEPSEFEDILVDTVIFPCSVNFIEL